jgi:hypothetical protein
VNTASLDKFALKYTQRMNREKDLALKVPEEWDFRAVTDEELPLITQYEYLREDRAFRNTATKWLESKIRGKSVRRLLLEGDETLFDELDLCSRDFQVWAYVSMHPLFPCPWMAFEREDAEGFARANSYTPAPLTILPMARMHCPGRFISDHSYLLSVEVEKHSTKDILRCFEKWLRKEAGKHKRLSGKASAMPWQKLKWLSARRLANAGLKYPSNSNPGVNGFIRQRVRVAPGSNAADVLPLYSSSGAWYDALKMANQELAALS